MKHPKLAGLVLAVALCHGAPLFAQDALAPIAAQVSAAVAPKTVLSAMEKVADWQLANPSRHRPDDWTQAVGYTGMMALANISGDRKYRDAMVAMGEKNGWKLGPNHYHADDHIVGQTYAELYLQLREPKMIDAMRAHFDDILANPREGTLEFTVKGNQDRWSWCDALFMAPPAWLRLWAATGDQRYFDLAVNHWWRTSDYLYDKEEHLYYRDSNYFGRKEANGRKVFWSRGNGWVMGGLVRMLQYIPAGHPARARFEQQYREMSARILELQQEDGLWRASLLDPATYPMKESSGSGLYTYALAWGVNQGLLDRAQYEPAVRKAWSALVANVDADGKLTHVQPIGLAPKVFDSSLTEVYGVGAFLLAGSEMYRMAVLEKAKPQEIRVSNRSPALRGDELAEAKLQRGVATPVVMDAATSAILNSQVIGDRILFPVNLAAGETHRYLVLSADRLAAMPRADVRTHARFVPERLDDFAWESDRIAHRTYGPAIIKDPKEQLVSSGIDVWVKRVRTPVLDKWYAAGNYHKDNGEGMDYYHVGSTRGCGGSTIYKDGKFHSSRNFESWKVLADGPLRSVFELRFPAWDAAGRKVSEIKRMSIDAGSNFTRVESRFTASGKAALPVAVGIVQRQGEGQYASDAAAGWMSYWEPQHGEDGATGCAVILPKGAVFANAEQHYLALGHAAPGKPFIYYFGAAWSKGGDYADGAAWEKGVRAFAERLKTPLAVETP
ncbi:glycoside hydrolase family 88 protein [Massilia endophytica]|uniref:glycoside hydrolase family 88 protein n=1 Tax=Massilia endophytica TaxID=2899220 RepID=UPI001E3E43F2|nr:glycoside hydrolase family 88 protein [Massilia endophytica]UGQ45923.1 glycoside hydrolase family 88 protein [Massilia endophytica]